MKRHTFSILLMLPLALFCSCKKDIKSLSSSDHVNSNTVPRALVYPFDWEAAGDFVPQPPGTNPAITKPWASGINQMFDVTDIAYDYKSEDGWKLIYNTFNTTQLTSPQFFALYNVYRGLYRLYFYMPPSNPTPSTYMMEGLSLTGSVSTSLLNFCGQDVVDPSTNVTATTTLLPYQIVSGGGWYVMQFEMAYDPNITNINYQNLQTIWKLSSVNVTSDTTYGQGNSSITGTITTPSSGFNFGGALGTGALDILGLGALNAIKGSIPTNIFDPVQKGVQSSLEGVVKNVLNAVFGGSGPTVQQVNLTMNSQFKLVGTQTSISLITSPTLIIPGTQWDPNTTIGYVPSAYNSPLGVFNVSAKPTIKVKKTVTSGSPATIENTSVNYGFTLDKTSFSEIFNPALNGIANIQDIKEEVVVFDDNNSLYYPPSPDDPASIYVAGEQETIGTHIMYTNAGGVTFTGMGGNKLLLNQLGVRISFKVVPVANPTHYSLIVKTFKANRVNI